MRHSISCCMDIYNTHGLLPVLVQVERCHREVRRQESGRGRRLWAAAAEVPYHNHKEIWSVPRLPCRYRNSPSGLQLKEPPNGNSIDFVRPGGTYRRRKTRRWLQAEVVMPLMRATLQHLGNAVVNIVIVKSVQRHPTGASFSGYPYQLVCVRSCGIVFLIIHSLVEYIFLFDHHVVHFRCGRFWDASSLWSLSSSFTRL